VVCFLLIWEVAVYLLNLYIRKWGYVNFFWKKLFFLVAKEIPYDHLKEGGEGDGEEDAGDAEEAGHDGHDEEDEEGGDVEGSAHDDGHDDIPLYLLDRDVEDDNGNDWDNAHSCCDSNGGEEGDEWSDVGDELHHAGDEGECDDAIESDTEYPEYKESGECECENRESEEELSADPE